MTLFLCSPLLAFILVMLNTSLTDPWSRLGQKQSITPSDYVKTSLLSFILSVFIVNVFGLVSFCLPVSYCAGGANQYLIRWDPALRLLPVLDDAQYSRMPFPVLFHGETPQESYTRNRAFLWTRENRGFAAQFLDLNPVSFKDMTPDEKIEHCIKFNYALNDEDLKWNEFLVCLRDKILPSRSLWFFEKVNLCETIYQALKTRADLLVENFLLLHMVKVTYLVVWPILSKNLKILCSIDQKSI